MGDAKITDGPWVMNAHHYVCKEDGNPYVYFNVRANGKAIALVHAPEPDARAIASVPDMIQALQDTLKWWDEHKDDKTSVGGGAIKNVSVYIREPNHVTAARNALQKAGIDV